MTKASFLKNKLQDLLHINPAIFSWITEKPNDGLWFFQKGNNDKFWVSQSFWESLRFDLGEADYNSAFLNDKLGAKTIEDLLLVLTTLDKDIIEKQPTQLLVSDAFGNQLNYEIEARPFIDSEQNVFYLLRFNHSEIWFDEYRNELNSLISVYEQTNEIAHIGGWEIDLLRNKITWTKATKAIHEVAPNYQPKFEESINFFKEGWSRDLIISSFNDCISNGTHYDVECKIITANDRDIWVRAFGKPEFKFGKCIRVYGAFQDIDEKKKREIELKATKNRFEKIFESSPIGILLVDKENKVIDINPACIRIFGFENLPKEEVLQLTFKDVIHPDHLATAVDFRQKLIAGELQNYKLEVKCFHSNGKIIWCNINTSILPGSDNHEDLIITQLEEITEQKELERVAKENADKFIKAFDNSPNGMGVIGLDREWVMFNNKLAEIIGYSKAEFRGVRFRDIIHPDDYKNDSHLIEQLVKGEIENYSIEKRYIHKNGHIVYCHFHVAGIYDEQEKVTSLIGQVVDMTETILGRKALQRSLNDLQGLLNATTQISIIETDLNLTVKKFNKGAENLLGYASHEVVGKTTPNLFHVKEEVADHVKVLSEKHGTTIAEKDAFCYDADLGNFEPKKWTYIRKDGSKFPVQLVITPVKDHEGTTTGYLGIGTDISELKAMEESLITAKEKAEMASKSKSDFLANMSHEIRTPLNGVIGFTDLLMKTALSDSQQNYMNTIYSSAISLLDLINDILDFSKIEAGKLEMSIEKTDLVEVCGQAIDLIKQQAHDKNLEVLLNISPQIKRFIYADTVRLKQIIINLLGNAVKFTHQGEIELKVEANPSDVGNGKMLYTFSIRDTGIGIAPENMDKIFFAFDQEDASTTRKYGGSGLGLSISNRLLEIMGSKLQVTSTQDKGSVFYFNVSFETEMDQNPNQALTRNVKNVLVVDDNLNNRTILKEMLAVEQISTTLLANGIEAINTLQKGESYDLAIIDYHMPYLNGLDLIKHIRTVLNLSEVELPIILLHSSGDDNEVKQRCHEYQVQFNVVKPIQMNALFNLIDQVQNPAISKDPAPKKVQEIDLSVYNFKIMVAEDNKINKYLTRTIIKKLLPNVELIEVDNGEEAVEAFKNREVELILMDIQMPILSGFEASQEIRKLENNESRIPIIALTARTVKGERERCLAYGMDEYVSKPVVFETLKEVIIEFLIVKDKALA
ncbi:PAS/PAC sensor hybrid histidine kinase [Arenibacter nanhaiticus]|uniref:Sensory/regulatory protein RpfC n=1 Tax=Arenibacter nanhaiticus TaxID=558155 RepID=A0A1M6B0P3_9FLAO|nr:PAS domain S-box protein [Arenibacter nanhaiticus]SHI42247.1 PAS/PAC sensor hybrid histidine kinase [Arenibacter nanhaiticus]